MVEWRFLSRSSGGLSVMPPGTIRTPLSCVERRVTVRAWLCPGQLMGKAQVGSLSVPCTFTVVCHICEKRISF